jgi:hypothetical protein
MATARDDSSSDNARLIRRLTVESDESAAAALFVQLCRDYAGLRHWLWEDFVRDAATRQRFDRLLRHRAPVGAARFSDLASTVTGAEAELRSLRASFPNRIFGGLNWAEVEALIGQFRAGRADLLAFLIALQWRRTGEAARRSPLLLQCLAEFLDPVLRSGERHRLNQLRTAVALVADGVSAGRRRTSVGPANWWKLQLLSYMLSRPRPSYTTRELVGHLEKQGLKANAKDVRRFCARHGIARDMRAGRPRATADTHRATATPTRTARSRHSRR